MSLAVKCQDCGGLGYVYIGVATVPCVCHGATLEPSQAERLASHRRKTRAAAKPTSTLRKGIYDSIRKVTRDH